MVLIGVKGLRIYSKDLVEDTLHLMLPYVGDITV